MPPRKFLHRLLGVFVLAALCISSHAETPEAVVTRQLEAMRTGDWGKFTESMHETTLQEFKNTFVAIISAAPESGPRDEMLKTFFGGKSVAELTATPPSAFFATFMTNFSNFNPALKQGMASAEGQVLGHVDEGPDKTHVVMRMTIAMGDTKVTKMDVTSLQRDGDSWKALLKGDMQAVMTGMARMLKGK
jgi:hypothetical protein